MGTSDELTVGEVKQKIRDAEACIEAALESLSRETGLRVDYVNVMPAELAGSLPAYRVIVDTKLQNE